MAATANVCSGVQQPPLIHRRQRIFIVVDDGDFPAFARPYARLGNRDDRGIAPHSDGLIVAFCNNIVGHWEGPSSVEDEGCSNPPLAGIRRNHIELAAYSATIAA